jgi:hypothetical protein
MAGWGRVGLNRWPNIMDSMGRAALRENSVMEEQQFYMPTTIIQFIVSFSRHCEFFKQISTLWVDCLINWTKSQAAAMQNPDKSHQCKDAWAYEVCTEIYRLPSLLVASPYLIVDHPPYPTPALQHMSYLYQGSPYRSEVVYRRPSVAVYRAVRAVYRSKPHKFKNSKRDACTIGLGRYTGRYERYTDRFGRYTSEFAFVSAVFS